MGDKQALVPRLRFPEFREGKEWEVCNLGNISTVVRGGSPRPISGFLTNESNGLNWLKIGDVDKEAKYVLKTQEKVKTEALSKTRVVHPGDLILSNSMSFGRPYLTKIQSCIHDGWIAITKIRDSVEREYLYYFIFSSASQAYFLDNAAGSGVLNLNADIIKNLPTSYPNRDEQKKIAGCLSSLDDLITAQAEKIEALKTHKNGLMQQLFPREGETIPHLRFPEFRDAGEWERHKLEDLAKRGSGHTPNKKYPGYYNGGIKWVSLADSDKLDGGYIYQTKSEISEDGLKNSSAVLHPPETVILSRDAGVGKSAVLNSSMAVSQHFITWRCDESKLSSWFLYYFLQKMKPILESIAVGNTIKTIGLPYFKEMAIVVPEIEEQQKIADCLSSLDALISEQENKLVVMKTQKKGLMQQLFPVMD